MEINTRQARKGGWWCNGTINGYDHYFEGTTILHARKQMFDLLVRKGVSLELCSFTEPKFYTPHPNEIRLSKEEREVVRFLPGYCKHRLDYL